MPMDVGHIVMSTKMSDMTRTYVRYDCSRYQGTRRDVVPCRDKRGDFTYVPVLY